MPIDRVDQYQAVVDDNSGQGDEAQKRNDAEGFSQQSMAPHGANEAEWDSGGNQQRLNVGLEGDGHQGVHRKQRHDEAETREVLSRHVGADSTGSRLEIGQDSC